MTDAIRLSKPLCPCIDCGGSEPNHSKDCEYMKELHADESAAYYDAQYGTDDSLNGRENDNLCIDEGCDHHGTVHICNIL